MQKSRRFGEVFCVLIVIIVMTVFVSCKEESLQTGELEIELLDGQSKSILPESTQRTVNAIQISGTGPNGATLTAQNFRLGGTIAISGLSAGTWMIDVTGYNGTETALGTKLTGTAEQSVTITSGKTTSATFNLHYLTSGEGAADVTVSWPSENSSIATVTGTVKTGAGTVPSAGDSEFTTSASNTVADLSFDSTIGVGNYNFDLVLTNKSGTTISLPMIDMVNVFDALTSTGTITLVAADVPNVATPVITVSEQSTTEQEEENYRTVTITSTTPDATVYYSVLDASPSGDGFDFANKTEYTGPFNITVPDDKTSITKYVRAIAVKDDYQDSVAISESVDVNGAGGSTVDVTKPTLISNVTVTRENDTAENPSFAVTYSIQGSLTISSFTWYVDGVAATDFDTDSNGNTFTYGGTLDAGQHQVMVKLGYNDGSGNAETVSGTLRFILSTANATPVITTAPVVGGVQVTLTCATKGASIYYTIDGSTTPTSGSSLYSSPFLLTSTGTIKAIAIMEGSGDSAVATSNEITIEQATAPTFSVTAGTYAAAQNVTITSSGSSAIYYTTDGSDPTTESTVYSSALSLAETTSVKAIAVASGKADSPIASATYTITYGLGGTGPAGGVIFYVNSNAANDGWTYLEVAPEDGASTVWATYNGSTVTVGDTEKTIGTGKVDTALIVKKGDAGAAMECAAKESGVYSDWFLPSQDELQAMNGYVTLSGLYWSSSEASTTNAWAVDFNNDAAATSTAKGATCSVRAVRIFL